MKLVYIHTASAMHKHYASIQPSSSILQSTYSVATFDSGPAFSVLDSVEGRDIWAKRAATPVRYRRPLVRLRARVCTAL